jgi:hypothetical protein
VARKLRKRKAIETHALFIFEIETWDFVYDFSVSGRKDSEGPYSEVVLVHVETVCRYPEKLVGRTARFDLYAERGIFEPWEWKQDSDWRPRGIGYLELPPSNGHAYLRLPHDSMPGLMTALAHKRVRYASLHGTPLLRGHSSCWSIGFSNDEGLDDQERQPIG